MACKKNRETQNGARRAGDAVAEWTAVSSNSGFTSQNHKIAARPEVDT